MTINTKYNIWEEVWFMYQNKIRQAKILEIRIDVSNFELSTLIEPKITYRVGIGTGCFYQEHGLFKTKEELLKSL